MASTQRKQDNQQTGNNQKIFYNNSVLILEDKQVSDNDLMQYQNDLSSLYSSQKQAYSFNNIGNEKGNQYIEQMLHSKNANLIKSKGQRSINYERKSTNYQDDKKSSIVLEAEYFQMIKNSQKKTLWKQISDNILTPFAPKFPGMYDNSKFIPEEVLKGSDEDNERTPYSEDKELNWDESDCNSDDDNSQDLRISQLTASLISSPLLKKKNKSEKIEVTLKKIQLQESFLHGKLIKSITEASIDPQKRKSDYSSFRQKYSALKRSKSNYFDSNKQVKSNTNSPTRSYMRKVRFELLPDQIQQQLSHQYVDSELSPYQIISKNNRDQKIQLDKILIVLENQDANTVQKIYIPKVQEQKEDKQNRRRLYSETTCLPSREQKKKIINFQQLQKSFQKYGEQIDQGDGNVVLQKYIRRKSCCCEECGGINKKLEKIKDIILDKDIPPSVSYNKIQEIKLSALPSPQSTKNSSSEFKFQRKQNNSGKFTMISNSLMQGDHTRTVGSSRDHSMTKIPSMDESFTQTNKNDKKQQQIPYDSFKEAILEDTTQAKTKIRYRNETCIPFSNLSRAPSFKTLRQEREDKVLKKNDNNQTLKEDESISSSQKYPISDFNEEQKRKKLNSQNPQQKKSIEDDPSKTNNQSEDQSDIKSNKISEIQEVEQQQEQKNVLSVLDKIQTNKQLKRSERAKSVQNIRVIKRVQNMNVDKRGDADKQTADQSLRNRSLQSLHNFLIRQQLSSRDNSQRNDKSLPSILNSKQNSENSYYEVNNKKDRNNYNLQKNDKYDVVKEFQFKKNLIKVQKKSDNSEKYLAYQNQSEMIQKTKNQIIAESYNQFFEKTKQFINSSRQRKYQSTYDNKCTLKSPFIYKQNTDSDKIETVHNSQTQEINDFNTKKKSLNSHSQSKRQDTQENIMKVKQVYEV